MNHAPVSDSIGTGAFVVSSR